MSGDKRVVFTRTPFRLTFAGGGTDMPEYYNSYGNGAVVNAAMNKYVYISISQYFYENSIRVHYSKSENDVTNVNEIQHPSIRESLKFLGITKGVQITTFADMPSKGTGIGSSSSFAVGLLNALHAYRGEKASPKALAEEAYHVEREILKEAGGKQDQYIAAFGNLQFMEFKKGGVVETKRVKMRKADLVQLQKHLLLMFTGKERAAHSLEATKALQFGSHVDALKKMANLAHKQYKAFEDGDWQQTGKLLHENWLLKKTLADGVSDPYIDRMYKTAMQNGAEGGKILGAGGGGFFLFFADPDKHDRIVESLPELRIEPFGFEPQGSSLIFEQGEPIKN